MTQIIRLREKFEAIQDYWHPRVAGELNGQHVKLARLKGEFIWHAHEQEDELFLVISGRLLIELRDKVLELHPGDMVIIPRGTEHRPVAEEEVEVLLFEPASTINTGNTPGDRTRTDLDRI